MGRPSVQGVRQVAPVTVRASAPGGSDSMRTCSVGGAGLNADMSRLGIQLGVHDEQPDINKPHAATATTRPMTLSVPRRTRRLRAPRPELYGRDAQGAITSPLRSTQLRMNHHSSAGAYRESGRPYINHSH